MDILYLLIPLSAILVLVILGVFAWALHSGQFDDLDQQAEAILRHDTVPDAGPFDGHQPSLGRGREQ